MASNKYAFIPLRQYRVIFLHIPVPLLPNFPASPTTHEQEYTAYQQDTGNCKNEGSNNGAETIFALRTLERKDII
jgi:hypothetical protein